MDTSRRQYRRNMQPAGFTSFICNVKETDLHISVDADSYSPELIKFCESRILYYRALLEEYIAQDPEFKATLQPYLVAPSAPPMALAMVKAGNVAGVGPMAAVAGAFAQYVGRDLLGRVNEVMVENGGDIFMQVLGPARVAVFAGNSPLSNRIALDLEPSPIGRGICTSSGTVGPSLSLGRADAVVILSPSTLLADAVATATANLVRTAADLEQALAFARSIPTIDGALLIKDDKMAAWGQIKLVPIP